MEHALYEADSGFFAGGRGAGRRDSDFITSVEVGPLFGVLVANYLDSVWESLDNPDPFHVVEVGAGRGALAIAVARARPRCRQAMCYTLVERSHVLRESQLQHLTISDGEPGSGGEYHSLAEIPTELPCGVILANELLDNLVFQVFQNTLDAGWMQWWVDPTASPSAVLLPADRACCERLDALIGEPEDGAVVPLQREAADWVSSSISALSAGRVLTFDYMSTTAELATRPWQEWLRTYSAQQRGTHPLADPGSQDITAEVCLDQLPTPDVVVSQAEWLRANGLEQAVATAEAHLVAEPGLATLESIAARSALLEAEALTDPAGLGRFTVAEWSVPPT